MRRPCINSVGRRRSDRRRNEALYSLNQQKKLNDSDSQPFILHGDRAVLDGPMLERPYVLTQVKYAACLVPVVEGGTKKRSPSLPKTGL